MSWNDISDNLLKNCISNFAESTNCIFKPKSGGQTSFQGVFDNQHKTVDPSTGMSISTQQPVLTFRLADLPKTPKKDDLFTIGGKDFKVRELKPDGQGAAVAVLCE